MSEPARPVRPSPVRTLALLLGSALALTVVLLSTTAQGDGTDPALFQRWTVPSDSDSTVVDLDQVAPADSDSVATALDSLRADSLARADDDSITAADTAYRAQRYVPGFRPDAPAASLFPRERRPLSTPLGSYWQHSLQLDSTGTAYIARETVAGGDVRYPIQVDRETYLREKRNQAIRKNWTAAAEQRARQRQQRDRAGLGVNISVPGGRQTAFSTIFGEPTVDLRVTGQADIRAGFDYRKSDQQALLTGNASQVDPDFKQDLRLGVTGRIGDKMRVDVNWDTNRDFDYQNQIKLQYTGYEDEILQSVEAGNVFLNTPSTLIQGGQSLFGIKTEWQMGDMRLTTVASTQKGQSNSLNIEGGAETTDFEVRPTEYDERKHFFLGYYFRNRWEDMHLENIDRLTLFDGFNRVAEIEVWRLQDTQGNNENERQVVAMVDLGEPPQLLTQADAFTQPVLPGADTDQYGEADLNTFLVPADQAPDDFLGPSGPLQTPLAGPDYQVGSFKRLQEGTDYQVNEQLGTISLSSALQDQEALAVAYRIETNQGTRTVGDLNLTGGGSSSQQSDRVVLKLLRPTRLQQPSEDGSFEPAAWYLEMRNIYQLGRDLKPTDFELRIEYQPSGQRATEKVPQIAGQQTLLQALGLDRANEQLAPSPDDQFDFIDGITIDRRNGLLIFPYLEPFGSRIADLVGNDPEAQSQFVFSDIYTKKPSNAELNTALDVYRIRGSFKGTSQSFYDLQAFAGLVPGSVRVTSGGNPLSEGQDYIVDYQGGTVTITNPAYLTAGADIEIDYETNSLFQLQQKTLLGARMDYTLDDRLGLGATVMRLSQKSPTDKFRIGEEPIANTIWGVDGSLDLQPRWLTRAVDALPFLQTKAQSNLSITGEFAQLRPGHTQTQAFEDERSELQDLGRDFTSDELGGISYIDDFEGFENTYTLLQPGAWRISSAPARLPAIDDDPTTVGRDVDSLRTTLRGGMAWYSLNAGVLETLQGQGVPIDATNALIDPLEVFPNRETGQQERFLQTLDMYFTPYERGPYNYTTRLDSFLMSPKKVWGGMVQRLPEGYNDFSTKNIEFLEFVMKVPENRAGRDAKLYVDLGILSEEVIPDDKLNTEDGLALTDTDIGPTRWARLPTLQPDQTVNLAQDSRRSEDVGLDGLASYPNNEFNPTLTEDVQFSDFLDALNAVDRSQLNPTQQEALDRAIAKAQEDPSGDDFRFYGDAEYFRRLYPEGSTVQERHLHYFPGTELNTIEAQSKLGTSSQRRGNSRAPDTEDLNINTAADTDNRYFEYQLALNADSLQEAARPTNVDDYVVEEINAGWYLVRIPVQQFTRRVGNIQDFSLVESIRLWTTGHEEPITVRFASLELVGSQWRESESVAAQERGLRSNPDRVPVDMTPAPLDTLGSAKLSIASINNFESRTYRVPPGAIVSRIQDVTGGGQRDSREQALVLRVEDLRPGQQRAVFKTLQGLDLLKYSNLRMFTHLHGRYDGGQRLEDIQDLDEARSKAKLFVRLGANELTDYYEYEQPLTPSSVTAAEPNPDSLWQTFVDVPFSDRPVDLNSMNIELGALNQLKFTRDEGGFPTDRTVWSDDPEIGLDSLVQSFAPPGTRIAVRGTPSLDRVNTMVIGLRNPDGSESVLEDVTVWVNELRATGYDERAGWSGLMNADLALADFARVKANFQIQTDGFGALNSTLDDRDQRDLRDWAVNTQVNMDKFIPERYGWSIPVSFEVKSNTATPRFDPNQGDLRVEELTDAVDNNPNLTEEEKAERKDQIVEGAQTKRLSRSFTGRVQKRGSRSKLLRNTLDGLSLSYSYAESDGRTPRQAMNDSWRWSTSLGYRFSLRRPRTTRPFGFLGDVPVVGVLGGLRFNYLPQSLSFNATASRRFTATKEREPLVRNDQSSDLTRLPPSVEFNLRDAQSFGHNRQFSLQYNPFNFLNFSFDTNTEQSLDALGADTLYSVVALDSTTNQFTQIPNLSREEAIASGQFTEDDFDQGRAYQLDSLRVLSTSAVVGDVLSGGASPRTDSYRSRLNATFRPKLEKVGALDWMSLQDVSYSATFSWRNGALGSNTGATAGTSVDLRTGISLSPQQLWQKFGFYRTLEEQQQEAEARKQQERQEREQQRRERQQQREREQQEREQEEQLQRPDEPQDAGEQPADGEQPPQGDAPAEGEPSQDDDVSEDTDEDDGGGLSLPSLPLPDPVGVLRRSFLAITGIRDINVTYNTTRSIDATNVGRGTFRGDSLESIDVNYSLYDALVNGQGPSLAYRLGLTRDLDDRIITDNVQVSDLLTSSHRFQGRTAINPSRALRISFNWSLEFSNREDVTLRQDSTLITTATESGDNRASVWAFRADLVELFERQFRTFERRPTGSISGNDRVVMTAGSLTEDFQQAYLNGLGTIDSRGLLPFPMPGWQVQYSGISNWPLIRSISQSASLRHGYSADYTSDFRSNLEAGQEDSFQLAGQSVQFLLPQYDVNAIRVNERYQPVIGLDLTFRGNIQASVAWNKSAAYSLAVSNAQLRESLTSEITASASYQVTGLTIPLFGRRINNQIGLNLTGSFSANDESTYLLQTALNEAALSDPAVLDDVPDNAEVPDATTEDNPQITTSTSRIRVSPKVTYRFSNRVSADFFVNYEKLNGDSRLPSNTRVNGGFNVRVSISN
ncbi:MAG: cell surface protein SprA [Bacteroidetes bacterium]|jgi:cell surface protein SprA|nr:cell surface protein SprA [Bacteroidota bacterium]